VTPHQDDFTYGNRDRRRRDSRIGTLIDETSLDGVWQITQAHALAVIVADTTQGDVRVIRLVPNRKP
jgi:hypothetical protein